MSRGLPCFAALPVFWHTWLPCLAFCTTDRHTAGCRECWTGWIVSGLNWVTETVHIINDWGMDIYYERFYAVATNMTGNATGLGDPSVELVPEIFMAADAEATHVANCAIYHFLACFFMCVGAGSWPCIQRPICFCCAARTCACCFVFCTVSN